MKKGVMTIVLFLTTYVFGEVSSNFTFSSNYIWRGILPATVVVLIIALRAAFMLALGDQMFRSVERV